MTYVNGDQHSPEPHWYPWTEDPAFLPNNKGAVEATFLRTEKQLAKEPEWKMAYASQVHEMVSRKAAVKLYKEVAKIGDKEKWEAVPSSGVITVNEREDAFRDLCLAAQEGVHSPNTTTDRLVVYKDQTSGLLMYGGRIQTFREDCGAVPLLPFQAWISTLLA